MTVGAGRPSGGGVGLSFPMVLIIGVVGGVLSGLLGVGGGVVMVPLLALWAGLGQREAHAISLAAIVPISLAGVAVYAWADEIAYAEAAALAVGAIAGSQIGARLLVRVDERSLKIGFGVFLLIVAASVALSP